MIDDKDREVEYLHALVEWYKGVKSSKCTCVSRCYCSRMVAQELLQLYHRKWTQRGITDCSIETFLKVARGDSSPEVVKPAREWKQKRRWRVTHDAPRPGESSYRKNENSEPWNDEQREEKRRAREWKKHKSHYGDSRRWYVGKRRTYWKRQVQQNNRATVRQLIRRERFDDIPTLDWSVDRWLWD